MAATNFDPSPMCSDLDLVWRGQDRLESPLQNDTVGRRSAAQTAASFADRRHRGASCDVLSFTASVLIVNSDVGAAYTLAAKMRLAQPAITTMCVHTAQSAVVCVSDLNLDAVIVEFGNEVMRGEAVAGAIFVRCPAAKPLMIALSGKDSRKRMIESMKLFDHVFKKPLKAASLAGLVVRKSGAGLF
jgi:hypothetical protein